MKALTVLTLVAVCVGSATSVRADYASAILADNPVAYWRMNEISGATAIDATANANDGAYLNGVTLGVPGALIGEPSNTATRYDGVTDGSNAIAGQTDQMLGSAAGLGADYSLEFWLRDERPITGPGSLPIAGYVMSRGSGAGAYDAIGIWGTSGFPFGRLYIFNGAVIVQDTASTPVVPGVWYHVGLTRSGNDVNLYLNGNLEISGTLNPTYGASTQFSAAVRPDGGWPYMGDIDEVAVYNTVLTESDFEQHYLASIPEPASALLLFGSGLALLRRRR